MKKRMSHNKAQKSKRTLSIVLFLILFSLTVGLASLVGDTTESLTTEQADALYGGSTNLTGHLYGGYILDYSTLFGQEVCGVTYLENGVAVSAAHCFEDEKVYYLGDGVISTSPLDNSPIVRYEIHPDWQYENLFNDVAVITYEPSDTFEPVTTKIGTPMVGCDYEIVAYGSTDQRVLSNADLRRSATICIDTMTEDRLYLSSPDGGVCFGDSGSPIFNKNSGELVGIMSAITSSDGRYSEENCFVNNGSVAVRVDAYTEFIQGTGSELLADNSCDLDNSVCGAGEGCYSNQCRKPKDFLYISALDYRSANYVFGDALGTALVGVVGIFGAVFLLIIIRSFRRTYY